MEQDVIAALQSGQLAGAYLDVFEREPLDPASPLWDMPNVLVSPHTASHSLGQNEAIFDIFLDNLGRWRSGQQLRNYYYSAPKGTSGPKSGDSSEQGTQ